MLVNMASGLAHFPWDSGYPVIRPCARRRNGSTQGKSRMSYARYPLFCVEIRDLPFGGAWGWVVGGLVVRRVLSSLRLLQGHAAHTFLCLHALT